MFAGEGTGAGTPGPTEPNGAFIEDVMFDAGGNPRFIVPPLLLVLPPKAIWFAAGLLLPMGAIFPPKAAFVFEALGNGLFAAAAEVVEMLNGFELSAAPAVPLFGIEPENGLVVVGADVEGNGAGDGKPAGANGLAAAGAAAGFAVFTNEFVAVEGKPGVVLEENGLGLAC